MKYVRFLTLPFAVALLSSAQAATISITGPQEPVFTHSTDSCNTGDFPDNTVRAFIDNTDHVQLLSSNSQNYYRRLGGLSLSDPVIRDCTNPVLQSGDVAPNAKPQEYYNNVWITGVWTDDGNTLYGFVHNEFHGERQDPAHGYCPSGDLTLCWYANLVAIQSLTAGKTYNIVRGTDNIPVLVAATPYVYQPDGGRQDMSSPSNIVKKDNNYYILVGGSLQHGYRPGFCVYRTDDITDPTHWRGWQAGATTNDGFVLQTVNPYTISPPIDPTKYICTNVLSASSQFNSITYNTVLQTYLAIGQDPNWQQTGKKAIIYSTSNDLIKWSAPQDLHIETQLSNGSLDKPSLLDPSSPSLIPGQYDRNYQYSGQTPYLYFILDHPDHPYNRDIVRYPISIQK